MKRCGFCKKAEFRVHAEDLRNPYLECPSCGATDPLPEYRYRIDWNTRASAEDGRPWFENVPNRSEAFETAKKYLIVDLDRAVISDRWAMEKPIVLIKNESVAARV